MKIITQSLGQPVCFFLLGMFCRGFTGLLITTQYWRSYLNLLPSAILLPAIINLGRQHGLSDKRFAKAANKTACPAITRLMS